jgi:acyl carrier protein
VGEDMKSVFEIVSQILVEELKVDIKKVTVTARLSDDLGADSLDTAELAIILSEKFDYTIPDKDFPNIKTVGDLVAIIEANISKKVNK